MKMCKLLCVLLSTVLLMSTVSWAETDIASGEVPVLLSTDSAADAAAEAEDDIDGIVLAAPAEVQADEVPSFEMGGDDPSGGGTTGGNGQTQGNGEGEVPADELVAPKRSLVLGVGEAVSLDVTLRSQDDSRTMTYRSKKSKVASVTADGIVKGKKAGKTSIVVSAGEGLTLSISVKVLKKPKKIYVKVGKTTLGEGESTAVWASFPKKTGGGYTITVDESGNLEYDPEKGTITAKALGDAWVTATAYNGKSRTQKITILPAPDRISSNKDEMVLCALGAVGATGTFTAVLPKGTAASIKYSVEDPSIASIDAKTGKVKALAAGETRLFAETHNEKQCECRLYVQSRPTSFKLQETSISMYIGQVYEPVLITDPDDAYKGFTLKSKNKKIASISGNTIKARKKGSTKVTLKAANGKKATIKVKVLRGPDKVKLNKYVIPLNTGEQFQLAYTLVRGLSRVSYTSSDTSVATVDPDTGMIEAVGRGSAVITARTLNGKYANSEVYVDCAPEDELKVTFMNIGRNDGILLCCQGEYAFIDSGMHSDGVKAVKYIRSRGITHLKYYIGTHGHKDHIGGAAAILAAFDVDTVLVPHGSCKGRIKNWAEGSAEKAAAKSQRYRTMKRGDVVTLGSTSMLCLGPIKARPASYTSLRENDNSLVIRVTHGSNTFLLTGDATKDEMNQIYKKDHSSLKANVLKNPHHNGRVEEIVKRCDPDITVFSTSSGRQPKSDFVKWIRKRGCEVYITSSNRHSHVTITSDGAALMVTTARKYSF